MCKYLEYFLSQCCNDLKICEHLSLVSSVDINCYLRDFISMIMHQKSVQIDSRIARNASIVYKQFKINDQSHTTVMKSSFLTTTPIWVTYNCSGKIAISFAKCFNDEHTQYCNFPLTECSLVTLYGNIDLGRHWLRKLLVAWRHKAVTWTNVDFSP